MAQAQVATGVNNVPNISLFGINKPELLAKLICTHGNQGMDYLTILRTLGYESPTGQKSYGHFEDDWYHRTFKNLNAVAAPGAGNNALVTLDPSSLTSTNAFYPQVTDDVYFPNGVIGMIIAIDTTVPAAPVLTIRPKVATENIGLIAAGQDLVINSNSQSEGAGPRKGSLDNLYQYSNQLKIVSTFFEVTGSQMANGPTYIPSDTEGHDFGKDYLRGMFTQEYRHTVAISGALLFDKIPTNTGLTDPATGLPYTGTEGLVPYIQRTGNIYPYVSGALTTADDDQIARVLDKELAGRYILRMMGNELMLETENYLVDYMTNMAASPVLAKQVASNVFNDNDALAAMVDFSLFKKGSRVHLLKKMDVLSHPQLYGAAGYKGKNMGILIAMDQQKVKIGEKETSAPSIGFRYKAFAGYSRMSEVTTVAGAGNGNKNTHQDVMSKQIRSEIGAHHSGGNKMILMTT
jgi:hypothetical protein